MASLCKINTLNDIENDIIEACKRGNTKAQTTVYEQYAKAMYNTALRMLQRADQAEDATQEAFIKAFSMLNSFRNESSFGAWLKRIVINETLMIMRKEKKYLPTDYFVDNQEDDNLQETWDFQEEEIKILLYALGKLPEKQRVILNLSLIEGFDNQEICQILSLTDANCRTSISRAKTALKQTIKIIKNERNNF